VTSPSRRRAAAALIFVLGAAACSGGGGPQDQPADDTGGADTTSQTVDDPSAGAAEDDASSEDPPAPEIDRYGWIGDGVAITMARAESPTGHVQAEIVRLLLTEFGYTVNDLENVELSAEYFHEVLGEGEIDLWADGRYPDHEVHWAIELADGSTVGDHVSTVGDLVLGGALRGFVTNALVAAETPGLTLDLIDDDDEVRAPYDAADPSPVDETEPDQTDDDDAEELLDGRVAVLGCVEDSLCADQIDEQIRFARWRTIEQAHGETADLTEAALRRIAAREPVIIHLESPSAAMTQLIPGENVVWLSLEPESVLDGSITPDWDQRIDGEAIAAPVPSASCSADPCYLSWRTTHIRVTARTQFLDDNPAAAALLEAIAIPAADISRAIARQDQGDDVGELARDWIETNRAMVDTWLAAAAST